MRRAFLHKLFFRPSVSTGWLQQKYEEVDSGVVFARQICTTLAEVCPGGLTLGREQALGELRASVSVMA
jgi:hypothetical protein